MEKCSFEGCDHIAVTITNNHCQTVHGMSKTEVKSKFGIPLPMSLDFQKLKKNTYHKREEWSDTADRFRTKNLKNKN